jgi:hypothetical protein
MPGIRQPDLPAAYGAALREVIISLQDVLQRVGEPRDERVDRVSYSQPSEQFACLRDLARRTSTLLVEYKNGTAVNAGSERSGWQGSAAAGADEQMIARFSAGCPDRERVARDAIRQHAELMRTTSFALTRISRERYVRIALATAGFDDASFRG